MSRNYDSSAVGVSYTRVPHLDIDYPSPSTAQVRIIEAAAVKMADGSILQHGVTGQLSWSIGPADMGHVLQLRDPTTGAAIPGATMTRQQLMLGLLAEIRERQDARDAAEAAATPTEA